MRTARSGCCRAGRGGETSSSTRRTLWAPSAMAMQCGGGFVGVRDLAHRRERVGPSTRGRGRVGPHARPDVPLHHCEAPASALVHVLRIPARYFKCLNGETHAMAATDAFKLDRDAFLWAQASDVVGMNARATVARSPFQTSAVEQFVAACKESSGRPHHQLESRARRGNPIELLHRHQKNNGQLRVGLRRRWQDEHTIGLSSTRARPWLAGR